MSTQKELILQAAQAAGALDAAASMLAILKKEKSSKGFEEHSIKLKLAIEKARPAVEVNIELLKALEELVEVAEIATAANIFGYPAHADGPLPKAKAAIAKARGQS